MSYSASLQVYCPADPDSGTVSRRLLKRDLVKVSVEVLKVAVLVLIATIFVWL